MVETNKKICIAIHGLSHGGAERVAVSWMNYLAELGHDVFALVFASEEDSYALDSRVRVVPIADSRQAYFQMPKAKQLLTIRKIIGSEKPDVMISFLPKMQITMMLATWGIRIKRIETVRNNPWVDKDIDGKRPLWNLCFSRSNAIIIQTKEQAQYFSKRLQKKCTVISNPLTADFLDRQKVYGENGARRFLAVARLSPQKNYPMMVRAFTKAAGKNPDCILDIYGAGSEETVLELEGLIHRLGMQEKIRLCGWRKDVSQILTAYDAFLMSSDYEGMPNALAEAMAAGLVCLSTDCKTGPKDMIDSGINGFLVATGEEEAFAQGIGKILEMSPHKCAEMGLAAKEKILTMCGEENTLARLKCLIEEVLH